MSVIPSLTSQKFENGQDNLLLPSIKYSKRLRESLHFNDLMNYLNSKETSNVLSWINNLKGYLKNYMQVVESELDFKKKNEKFCFDLNYIIDVILDRFLKARRLDGNVKFYHNTQVNSKEVLNGNNALNCKRDIYNDITNFKKLRRMFYNFCEDSSYIKDNFSLIKSLGKCEAYLPDIQNRKRILTKLLRRRGHSSPELFNYSKECNLNNLGNFLNTMNCNPENSEKEEGSQHEKGMQLNDQVSRPDPETATVSEQGEVDGDLPADTKELMDLEKNQDEEEFNLNTTYSAASLLGTSVVLYFLSRARPFGSWIQSKNQRRSKIVPMRNNGETDEWHLNNFHTEPINSELNEYHMPYNAIGEI